MLLIKFLMERLPFLLFTITVCHVRETRNAVHNGENPIHLKAIIERTKAYVQMALLHLFKQPTTSPNVNLFSK